MKKIVIQTENEEIEASSTTKGTVAQENAFLQDVVLLPEEEIPPEELFRDRIIHNAVVQSLFPPIFFPLRYSHREVPVGKVTFHVNSTFNGDRTIDELLGDLMREDINRV